MISSPRGNSGIHLPRVSPAATLPCSRSCIATATVIGLVIDATQYRVVTVLARPECCSATPNARSRITSSSTATSTVPLRWPASEKGARYRSMRAAAPSGSTSSRGMGAPMHKSITAEMARDGVIELLRVQRNSSVYGEPGPALGATERKNDVFYARVVSQWNHARNARPLPKTRVRCSAVS